MKNKKGFTLIEILATIVVLSVIILIAVPTYNTLSSKSKTRIYNTKLDSIKTSAEFYAKDKEDGGENITSVNVGTLLDEGYLDKEDTCVGSSAVKDMCDPRDKTSMREITVNITKTGKSYTTTIK